MCQTNPKSSITVCDLRRNDLRKVTMCFSSLGDTIQTFVWLLGHMHVCIHDFFYFYFFSPLKSFQGFFLLSPPRNSEIICYTIIFFFGIILFNFSDWNMLKIYIFLKKLLEYLRLARLEGTYIELIIVLIKPLHICSKGRNLKNNNNFIII